VHAGDLLWCSRVGEGQGLARCQDANVDTRRRLRRARSEGACRIAQKAGVAARVPDGPMEDPLDRLDVALESVEGVEHRLSHAATNTDLVAPLGHCRNLPAGGVSHRHPAGVNVTDSRR
jgi:hypothetical protein